MSANTVVLAVDGFKVYAVSDPTEFVISWDGQWLDGAFPTAEAALASGKEQVSR